jgi:hypothetical protein
MIRKLVSGNKRRFKEDGYDLDLAYITARLIGMAYPSEGSEALYRNPISEVRRLLDARHGTGNYKVFNLCSERCYDAAHFGGRVERFPFDDHAPPPLQLLLDACTAIHAWLQADAAHIAAVHCKAGKGRTGVVTAAYLLYSGQCACAADALRLFNERRTTNGKGVTIPSQIRYVQYFERILIQSATVGTPGSSHRVPEPRTVRLHCIRMHTAPSFDVGGGCDPYAIVELYGSGGARQVRFRGEHVPYAQWKDRGWVDLDVPGDGVPVEGDTAITLYDWDRSSKDDRMCWTVFNTAFLPADGYVLLHKDGVDGAAKDSSGRFSPYFALELCFGCARPRKQI